MLQHVLHHDVVTCVRRQRRRAQQQRSLPAVRLQKAQQRSRRREVAPGSCCAPGGFNEAAVTMLCGFAKYLASMRLNSDWQTSVLTVSQPRPVAARSCVVIPRARLALRIADTKTDRRCTPIIDKCTVSSDPYVWSSNQCVNSMIDAITRTLVRPFATGSSDYRAAGQAHRTGSGQFQLMAGEGSGMA